MRLRSERGDGKQPGQMRSHDSLAAEPVVDVPGRLAATEVE